MKTAGVDHVKSHPEEFFSYLKKNNYPVFHRSPIFLRDFQFGLWRYLKDNLVWRSYMNVESVAREVLDAYEAKGVVRRITNNNFELQMPQFLTPAPAAKPEEAPKPKPAAAPSAAPAPAAAAATPAAASPEEDKARKLAELQAKMAAAKAAKEGGAAPAPSAAKAPAAPTSGGDDDKARKIAELQAKMAAAKAAKEEGAPAPAAPASAPSAASEPAVASAPAATTPAAVDNLDDEKARKLAELKAKMEEAKRKREAGA